MVRMIRHTVEENSLIKGQQRHRHSIILEGKKTVYLLLIRSCLSNYVHTCYLVCQLNNMRNVFSGMERKWECVKSEHVSCSDLTCSSTSKYCLYLADDEWHHYNEVSTNLCSKNNRDGWLLEIYDDDVQQLVDQFVACKGLQRKIFLLGTEMSPNKMMWVNGASCLLNCVHVFHGGGCEINIRFVLWKFSVTGEVANQEDNLNTMVCLIKAHPSVDSEETLRYVADNPRSLNNVTSCLAARVWSRGKTCYFPLDGRLSWYKGHYMCAKLGGGLAVLDELSADDIKQMWNQLDLTNDRYWIGLSRTLLTWKKTEQPLNNPNWLDGFPNDLLYNYRIFLTTFIENNPIMNDCSIRPPIFNVICMQENKNFATTPPSPTTTTDLMKPSSKSSIVSASGIFDPQDPNANTSYTSNDDAFTQSLAISFGIILPSLIMAIVILASMLVKLKKQSKRLTGLKMQVDPSYEEVTPEFFTKFNKNNAVNDENPYISLSPSQGRA
ncbi:hypothetical protein HELRODRAFT_178777 [Helobdella robusta]|uniref:C-type lectin domain-containing protein n=1 Tax=Helobdella robusta TaxID=6412 RepID=T1FDQ3_HELRO|nr:hypothetical protein HELRODRAFT_178777 [Helobdella robusta]ESN96973.1 hypothetical protein HELRODRAFT_178777 [Helobdella robusta]